jgi:hypothetical protein
MPPKPKNSKNRKLLLYAGAAGALLALIMIMRKSSAATAAQTNTAGVAPVSTASDGLAAGSSGLDNSSQLASFEQDLLNQLPQVIANSISAGTANGLPAQAASATTTNDALSTYAQIQGQTLDLLTSLRSTGLGGEQTGAAQASAGPAGVAPAPQPAPAAVAAPPPAPSLPSWLKSKLTGSGSPQASRSGSEWLVVRQASGGAWHTYYNDAGTQTRRVFVK